MEDLERLAKRDIEDAPAMRADPALPVYLAIMRRIVELMPSDPAPGGTEGDELSALVETALVYERRWFPEFSHTRGAVPSPKSIDERLASMAQGIRDQQGFQWDEYEALCRDARAELLRVWKLLQCPTSATGKHIPKPSNLGPARCEVCKQFVSPEVPTGEIGDWT